MPMTDDLIPPPPLPLGTDLPGLLRSIADTELAGSAGLAVALRAAADELVALRAAVAAQPQPLYEGSRQGMILRAVDDTWPDRVVVYPAVAGSATPTGADDVR